uniref:Uncharacterized protein n=1 Tax=Denticeps clupeoides TaxID=299321 RepID=A0AAY4CJD7_9TELE
SDFPHGTGTQAVPGNVNLNAIPPPEYSQALEDVSSFSESKIRQAFVRKVYLTLMVQLLATVGIICAFLYWYGQQLFSWKFNITSFISNRAGTIVLVLVLACCGDIRRKVPFNYILLGLFTVVEGFMLGSVTVFYQVDAVFWAVGATAFVSFALSVFAMQTKWDFTAARGVMWVICWTLFSFAILCAILRSQVLMCFIWMKIGSYSYCYLVMDTQMMLGGKHRYSISPEEYIFAALNLYLDVVTLFLLLLQLIGLTR